MSKTVISQVPHCKGISSLPPKTFPFQFSCQGEQEVLARMEVEVQSARLLTWKVDDYLLAMLYVSVLFAPY